MDKMRGLPGILPLFRNSFDKFNKIGARMLDAINQMRFNYLKIAFRCKTIKVRSNVDMDFIN